MKAYFKKKSLMIGAWPRTPRPLDAPLMNSLHVYNIKAPRVNAEGSVKHRKAEPE